MGTINSGTVLRLLPKTFYDFSKLQAGNTQIITLAQHIEVAPFLEATFMLRAHSLTLAGTATLIFDVVYDGYDFGDPGLSTSFLQNRTAAGAGIAQVTWTSATTAPFYSALAVPTNHGRLLAIQLTGNVPAGAAGGTCALSVDLSLKGGDPRARTWLPNSCLGYVLPDA